MRASVVLQLAILANLGQTTRAHKIIARQETSIPDYVKKYAPLVYLDQNELFLPSDIASQLPNTSPYIGPETCCSVSPLSNVPSPLNLTNLNALNPLAKCTNFDDCNLFLTSRIDPSTFPSYLYGVLPTSDGLTPNATSATIVVNAHTSNSSSSTPSSSTIVDAFYFFFYAFNLGELVLNATKGNHVGDWEHIMIRFLSGVPLSAYYSQHDAGETYAWSALSKSPSGRPYVYSSIGGHASYAVPGLHRRTVLGVDIDDHTSAGPLWDPSLAAYYYTYVPEQQGGLVNGNGTFVGVEAAPVEWLYYLGRWGDRQFPDGDPRQNDLANVTWTWETGPTGPLDKVLNRTDACPQSTCTTLTALPSVSGTSIPVTVTRTTVSTSSGSTSAAASSPTSKNGGCGGGVRPVETTLAMVAGLGILAGML